MNLTANYFANLATLYARQVTGSVLSQNHPLAEPEMHNFDAADMETLHQTLRRRRWRQFSLRSLLIVVTLFAIIFGTFVQRIRMQHQAAGEIRKLTGRVTYKTNWLGHVLPESIAKRLGDDACGNVVSVALSYRTVDRRMVTPTGDELEKAVDVISRLPHVTRLSLHTLSLSDDDVARLAPLRHTIEDLSINELFHGNLRGNNLEHFVGWTQLRSLTILSTGLNEMLNLQPLASLPNLTYLSIGIATLNKKAFADISKIDSLQTLNLFACRFNGEHLQQLQELSHLDTLSLHNIHPETEYASYTMDEFGKLQPNSKPNFRFERSSDAGLGQPQSFPSEYYRRWLDEILPNVQVDEIFSS